MAHMYISENKESNHMLVAGFAQFPKGTPIFETQKVIGCILIIDLDTETIVDANFTFLRETTNQFIASLIRGRSIKHGVDELISEVEKRVLIPGQRALIQSIIKAYERYCETKL